MKKFLIGLIVTCVVVLPAITGAATLLTTGFETTDDAGYVIGNDIPLGSTLADGSKWETALENDGGAVPGTSAKFSIQAPVSSASEWGSQCLECEHFTDILETGTQILEKNSLVTGYSTAVLQFDIRFPSDVVQASNIRVRLSDTGDWNSLDGGIAIVQFQHKNDNDRLRLVNGDTGWSTNSSLAVDTDYQVVLTYSKGDSPEVTLSITEDPYGTPNTTFWSDQVTTPQGQDDALGFHLALASNDIAKAQIDNIIVSDTISSGVCDWMMY